MKYTSRMEMIFIDTDGQARKTGIGAIMDTPLETWLAFLSAKSLEVSAERAQFIIDYYNRAGELSDSIRIDAAGFRQITGEDPKSDAEYRQIDRDFWRDVRAQLREKEMRA